MLNVVRGFSRSNQNGLFINSCFAHCQSETQDTWFADNSPVFGNKVSLTYPYAVLVKKILNVSVLACGSRLLVIIERHE
jgi:hypothetical protein